MAVGEQLAFQMTKRRSRQGGIGSRELQDRSLSENSKILDGPLERRESSAAGLVGNRHRHIGSSRERLEERPLRCGQILEAIGKYWLDAPRVEIAPETIDGCAPENGAVLETQPIELGAICASELRQVSFERVSVQKRRIELGERAE